MRRYMETMLALPAFQEWTRDGLAETIVSRSSRRCKAGGIGWQIQQFS